MVLAMALASSVTSRGPSVRPSGSGLYDHIVFWVKIKHSYKRCAENPIMSSPLTRPLEAGPSAAPRSLPAWVYNHPEMTRLELERILRPSWHIACHASQIARGGG